MAFDTLPRRRPNLRPAAKTVPAATSDVPVAPTSRAPAIPPVAPLSSVVATPSIAPRATTVVPPSAVLPTSPVVNRARGGFNPNASRTVAPAGVDTGSNATGGAASSNDGTPAADAPSLEFLKTDRQALDALEAHNPRGVEQAQETARTRALQVMNAARTLGPAIGVAMAQGGEDEQQAQRFVETMTLANDMALDAAHHLDLDPSLTKNRWAFNVLERLFVEGIAKSATLGKGPGKPGTALAQSVVQAAQDRALDKPDYHPLPAHLNVSLALMQAMGPVMVEQQTFDFYRDRDGDLKALAQLLMERASTAVIELLDPLAREEDRATVFQVFVNEGGHALAACWRLEATKIAATLKQKSQNEIDKLLSSRPNGLPLETVIEQFEQQFRRLKMLATQQSKAKPKARSKPAA